MPPKSKTSSLKQGTLPFATAKHGAAGKAHGKPSLSASARKPSSEQQREKVQQTKRKASSSSESSARAASPTSNDDDVVVLNSPPPAPSSISVPTPSSPPSIKKGSKTKERLKLSVDTKPAGSTMGVKRKLAVDLSSDEEEADEPQTPKSDLTELERSGRLNEIYRKALKEMGPVPPIHAKNQTKIHHILRIFDTSYEYGPCVGMTRLERWERAFAMGLYPPQEVREILLTKQAQEEDQYKQSVLYGEV